MCIEARLDGCVKRLLGIPVLKWPIFFVRWSLKEFSAPFLSDVLSLFYRMFLSPSVSCFSLLRQVLLFSCCRRLCVLSFYRPLLSRAHILMRVPRGTLGCVPVSYVRSALFARSIRDFIAEEWTYLLCQEGKEKNTRFLHT